MSAPETSPSGPQLLAVSCAGGMARQYRVQVRDPQHPAGWSLVGSFRDSQIAETAAASVRRSGRQVRIVACQSLPTAA
jgi:hypothetical protein